VIPKNIRQLSFATLAYQLHSSSITSKLVNRWTPDQAEAKIKRDIFEGKYDIAASGKEKLKDFIERDYLPWTKTNKASFSNESSRSKMIIERFGSKAFREITPEMLEKFKSDLQDSITRRGTRRSQADVNHYVQLLSSVFELAIKYRRASKNPCREVKRLKLNNQRYRYLLPEEEPNLLAVLKGRLAHLKPLVVVSIGTGLRKQELLRLRCEQVNFSQIMIVATHTKGKKNRHIPMNEEVLDVLLRQCRRKSGSDYVFVNPNTGLPYTDIKHSFATACSKDSGAVVARSSSYLRYKTR
jgi:integrase